MCSCWCSFDSLCAQNQFRKTLGILACNGSRAQLFEPHFHVVHGDGCSRAKWDAKTLRLVGEKRNPLDITVCVALANLRDG